MKRTISLFLVLLVPFSVFAAERTIDLYDVVLLVLKWFPSLGPHLISLGVILAALVAICTTGIGTARIIVKLTFWTGKDDEALTNLEAFYYRVSTGPLKPLFTLIDRLSLLHDIERRVIQPK